MEFVITFITKKFFGLNFIIANVVKHSSYYACYFYAYDVFLNHYLKKMSSFKTHCKFISLILIHKVELFY